MCLLSSFPIIKLKKFIEVQDTLIEQSNNLIEQLYRIQRAIPTLMFDEDHLSPLFKYLYITMHQFQH